MRSRKELIYCNISELTQEEVGKLADYELNCCDKCGEIDLSKDLYWNDYDYHSVSKYSAVCGDCFKILQYKAISI